GLDVHLHRAVEDEFRREGTLRVVSEGDADLVLSGTIRRFTSVPVAFSATDEAVQYQGIMQVSLRLTERESGHLLFENKLLQESHRLGDALADLRTPPLFGGSQVLVLRTADKLREEDQAGVLDALPTLGAGGTLVLVVAGDPDQRRKLLGACLRARAGFGFPELDAGGAPPWVVRLARERGHEIAPAAVEELVERAGPA